MLGRIFKFGLIAAIVVSIWKFPEAAARKGVSFLDAAGVLLGGGWDAFMRFVEGL